MGLMYVLYGTFIIISSCTIQYFITVFVESANLHAADNILYTRNHMGFRSNLSFE